MESCGCGTLVCSAVKIMAAVLFLFLHFLTAPALESASDKDSPFKYPHLTRCVSTNMETFYCRWDVGTLQNLSKPEDLRLFYITKFHNTICVKQSGFADMLYKNAAWKYSITFLHVGPLHASSKEWSECPHYSIVRLNECFFGENHTSIWIDYSIQLRSRDQTILYDEKHFNVQDIVQPDPPIGLNWTMLNVSLTGSFYDIMLSWKPPPSADVNMGWMTLQYEVQYRKVHSEHWDTAELVKSTHRSVYGLQTNVNYEVRVRCKKHGEKKFGGFSDSIFVHVPSEASRFPLVALLIFGTLCLIAILMLVILSKQEKLMVILLPPVPGPKIRGIDPELLKKGKLKEFTSILGSPPELRPELYTNDPWVEFIDLDFEEQSDRLTNLDTDFLMDRSLFSNSSHLSIGFRDDDSGRASCCDPDLASDPETSHFHSLVTNQIHHKEPAAAAAAGPGSASPSTTAGEPPSVVPVREALYTQVSEVKPSGKVLLYPEDEMEENTLKDSKEIKTAEKKLLLNTDHRGYTSELNAGKMSQSLPTCNVSDSCSTGEDLSSITCSSSEDYHQPSHESVTNPTSHFHPTPVYTVVEDVDRQNSLVLTPNSIPALQLTVPKAMPTPDGYLTPDLWGSITP
ncbi:growth hormone receptor b isoform X2 [Phycodurus eques]|uniref:growth hormone receptor b isoform X2 n=1 Tax=Phycodurus eques TaxID=693459 RepID=UPI002ACE3B60|nr:growth hormone receptor b isoform X2 [Phycodurus eques]